MGVAHSHFSGKLAQHLGTQFGIDGIFIQRVWDLTLSGSVVPEHGDPNAKRS